MSRARAEDINVALAEHQRRLADDEGRHGALLADLQAWSERFYVDFRFQLAYPPALALEMLDARTLGHFRCGRNGFGLLGEIALNVRYIDPAFGGLVRPYWRTLSTLLHELLHAWQESHGSPPSQGSRKRNFHNAEYRKRAFDLGLLVSERGTQEILKPPTPFLDLLQKYGAEAPQLVDLAKPVEKKKGTSKMRLYECSCPWKIRQSHSQWPGATCAKCGQAYGLKE